LTETANPSRSLRGREKKHILRKGKEPDGRKS